MPATWALDNPVDCDRGGLVVGDTIGTRTIRRAADKSALYSGGSRHGTEPVARGKRLASFIRIQRLVRAEQPRRMLLELDLSIQVLNQNNALHCDVLRLTGLHHNLLRTECEA